MKLLSYILACLIAGCTFLLPDDETPSKNNPVAEPADIAVSEWQNDETDLESLQKTIEKEETDTTEETREVLPKEVSVKEVCVNGLIHYYTPQCHLFPKYKQDGSLWKCSKSTKSSK